MNKYLAYIFTFNFMSLSAFAVSPDEPYKHPTSEELTQLTAEIPPYFIKIFSALVTDNDLKLAHGHISDKITSFHAISDPQISVKYYIERIMKYGHVSPSVLVAAFVNMDRIISKKPFVLSSLSFHRFFLCSVMISCKYFDDIYYSNAVWAKIGGLPLAELNKLESEVLGLLDWKINVSVEEYESYLKYLRKRFGSPVLARPDPSSAVFVPASQPEA